MESLNEDGQYRTEQCIKTEESSKMDIEEFIAENHSSDLKLNLTKPDDEIKSDYQIEYPSEPEEATINPIKKPTKTQGLEEYKNLLKKLIDEYIIYLCPFCDIEFKKKHLFMHHINNEHNMNTLDGMHLREVYDKTLKIYQFQCIDCTTIINTQINPVIHRLNHLKYDAYKCRICSKTFNKKFKFEQHLRNCQKGNKMLQMRLKNSVPNTRNSLKFACPYCNLVFKTSHESINHRRIVHARNKNCKSAINVQDNKLINNETLSKTIKVELSESNSNAQTFEEENEDESSDFQRFNEYVTYICLECNEPLSNYSHWGDHIIQHHQFLIENAFYFKQLADGSSQCSDCGSRITTTDKVAIQKHKLQHMPIKRYACNICDYRSHNKVVVNNHIRTVHFKHGEYECPVCAAIFETSYKCTLHIKADHTESEYPSNFCSICLTSYPSLHSLNRHSHSHNIVNKKANKCYACDSIFDSVRTLKKHFAETHLSKKPSADLGVKGFDDNEEAEFKTTTKEPLNFDTNINECLNKTKQVCNNIINGDVNCKDNTIIENISETQKSHHIISDEDEVVMIPESIQVVGRNKDIIINCPICKAVQPSKQKLMQHLKQNHNFTDSQEKLHMKKLSPRRFDKYECLDCGKQIWKNDVLTHRFSHFPYKPFECRFCNDGFETNSLALNHSKICTNNNNNAVSEKPARNKNVPMDSDDTYNIYCTYACPECNEEFNLETSWKSHINQYHQIFDDIEINFMLLPNGDAECLYCGIILNNWTDLKQQHKLNHMAHKSFICALCKFRSQVKQRLLFHIKMNHFAPGIFKCFKCGIDYETINEYHQHNKSEHSEDTTSSGINVKSDRNSIAFNTHANCTVTTESETHSPANLNIGVNLEIVKEEAVLMETNCNSLNNTIIKTERQDEEYDISLVYKNESVNKIKFDQDEVPCTSRNMLKSNIVDLDKSPLLYYPSSISLVVKSEPIDIFSCNNIKQENM